MSITNQCYKMFNLMIHGYETNNKDELEQGARCLLEIASVNPFDMDSDEMEAFFQMKRCYEKWKSMGIDHKINRRKMVMWTEKLCSLNPANPYKYDKKAEEEEQKIRREQYEKARKEMEELHAEKIILDEPIKVLNVPQNDKKNRITSLFSRKRKEGETNDSP